MTDIGNQYGNTTPDWGRSTDVFRNLDGSIDNSTHGTEGTEKSRLSGDEKTSDSASKGVIGGDVTFQKSAIEDREDVIRMDAIPQPSAEDGTVQDQFTVNDNTAQIMAKLNAAEGTRDVMFDIYAVLELLQDTSQKLKNAMRQLRAAEVTLIQSNLMAQAEKQRENATMALIATACLLTVQVVAQGVVLGKMGKSLKGIKNGTQGAQESFQMLAAVNQLVSGIGQSAQGIIGNVKSILDAKITELQAQQKGFEEQLDQIKDTYASADDTLKKAIEIYQAVTSKESQTIEGILRA